MQVLCILFLSLHSFSFSDRTTLILTLQPWLAIVNPDSYSDASGTVELIHRKTGCSFHLAPEVAAETVAHSIIAEG